MTLGKTAKMLLSVAAVAVLAAGCCKKEKEQIQMLEQRANELTTQNQDLESQLAQADARASSYQQRLEQARAQLDRAQSEIAGLRGELAEVPEVPEGWERRAGGDMVTVGSDILFAPGRAELTASGKSKLDEIHAQIRQNYAGMKIRVFGHTDGDPINKSRKLWKDNWDLSAGRALAVVRYLVSKGVDAEYIEGVAMSEYHPVAPNNTKAGKTQNRRVEIFVVR